MSLQNLPAVRNLSKTEKIELVSELWNDIAEMSDDLEVTPEEKALLEERYAAHQRSPRQALSLNEFKHAVRNCT